MNNVCMIKIVHVTYPHIGYQEKCHSPLAFSLATSKVMLQLLLPAST